MSRLRRAVLIAGVAVCAFATVGGVTALYMYNTTTRIDRSIPTVVVRQYVDELLIQRDDARASLFACNDQTSLYPMIALRDQLKREEVSGGFGTQVVPASLTEREGGKTVIADLRINQGTGTTVRTRIQIWEFGLRDENGWRVCSAEQLPGPAPSASVTPPTTS